MRLRPGTFLWLVRHDLRLDWLRFRALFGSRPAWLVAGVVALVLAAFHALAWPLARSYLQRTDPSGLFPLLAGAALFVLPWQIAQGINGATRALYTRSDLDLLMASPVSARAVVAARALAMAIESTASAGLFLFPIADMSAWEHGLRWLAIYPALVASSLFATALGLALTAALFALLGPRRTRFASQILATFIASIFILGVQIVHVLRLALHDELIAWLAAHAPQRTSLLMLPVRAAMAGPADLLAWGAVSLVTFVLVAILLGPAFLRSAVRSAGAGATPVPIRQAGHVHRFRPGVAAALRRKEWALLRRDPWLASQLLLQIVYTMPISVVIWRSQGAGGSLALAAAPAMVVIASQLAASLAWIAVSSEDAPEFIASAPVSRGEVERRKLEAIALPLAILLALPLIGLAWFEFAGAAITGGFAVAASASTALLNLWHPMPGRRAAVMRRHAQSKLVGLMEHSMALCWAVAVVLFLLGSTLWLAPVALVVGLVWLNRPASRTTVPS